MLFVVLVDFRYGNHARIFSWRIVFLVGIGFIPVKNTTYERRDQVDARFGARTRLREGEQQRQVTVDAFFFQLFGCTNALPGGRQLDQDTIVADTRIIVEFNDTFCFGDRRFGVIRQTRVNFGRNTPRHQLQDLQANIHRQLIGRVNNLLRAVAALLFRPGDSIVNQLTIFRDLRCVKNERRVSCSILRLIQFHCRDISGISHYGGELTKGGQFVRHDRVSL